MSKPRQAVVLAAGRGSRLRALAPVKPLHPVAGLPLLERSIRTLQQCGVDDIIIVTGHAHAAIESWLHDSSYQARLVYNQDWSSAENGTSLLAAAPYVKGPFLLLMADHVYVPELIASLCSSSSWAPAMLAVDGQRSRKDIDLHDVTRVMLTGDRVTRIGKGLPEYDGFDTGAFLCQPEVFSRMEECVARGKTRITDLMQGLADEGRLQAHRIDGHYWQDVDTPEMHAQAETALLAWAAGKSSDGLVAKRLNRPVSRWFTRYFLAYDLTPNQVSMLAFGIACLAALCMAAGSYWLLAIGGLLVQLASVVDGCDGELARLRLAPSEYGGWFDALLDRYADGFVLAALTWHLMQRWDQPAWMWLGMAAIAGSFVASYSAHKADRALPASRWRMGRDTRSLLVMSGTLLNLPALTLALIAVIMNITVIHRMFRLREREHIMADA